MVRNATKLAIALGLLCAGTETARADSRVLIARIDAIGLELDDESRATLEEGFATAASAVDAWRVVDTGVAASLLRRDGGCGILDDACLERAAERRSVDRILLIDVQPDAAVEEQVLVTVELFDRYTRTVRARLYATLEADDLESSSEVADLAEKIVPVLAEVPEEGAAVVRAVAGAEVFLDGVSVGTVPASGELVLTPLPVGRRELRVVRPSRTVWEAPVIVRSCESVAVTVDAGASVASFDSAPVPEHGAPAAALEPPPAWVLTVPGVILPGRAPRVLDTQPLGRAHFHIPALEEHVERGEFRSADGARVGFLPNVSSRGARVTAKLHF